MKVMALALLLLHGNILFASQRNFTELCLDDELTWEWRITIMRIMNDLGASDCGLATRMIKDTKRLVLPIGGQKISHLEPLVRFRDLQTLIIPDNKITSIASLKVLDKLEVLGLRGNRVFDLKPLIGLIHLRALDISFNPIDDLSVIGKLSGLRELVVDPNQAEHLKDLPDGVVVRVNKANPGLQNAQ